MNFTRIWFTALTMVLSVVLAAQSSCGTTSLWSETDGVAGSTSFDLQSKKTAYFKQLADFQTKEFLAESKKAGILIIPMVVHVIHNCGPENVNDSVINTMIDNLNNDFNGRYPNKSQVFDEFQDILGNTEVEFRLAKIGPEGDCVNGINRILVDEPYFSNLPNGRDKIEDLKRKHNWDVNKYMNFYVVGSIESSSNNPLIAYTYLPKFNLASTDGIVNIFNRLNEPGGSPSHEMGHYLGLNHTFSFECSDTIGDGIDDTPKTLGHALQCPTKENASTCGSLDNVHNIMDLSTCRVNFTKGQSAVMRGVLFNQRETLVSAQNLIDVGADYELTDEPTLLCSADFNANVKGPICPGSEIQFFERTVYNAVSFNWIFEGGIPSTSTERDPTVLYNTPGKFAVTLTVSDGDTTITLVKDEFVSIQDNNLLGAQYGEGFETIDLSTTESIFIDNKDNDRTFEVYTDAGFNSASSLSLQNRLVVSGREDDIITNTMDITGVTDAVLSFDYAFARKNANNDDQLEVYVSSDCGVNWTLRKRLRADVGIGSASSLLTAPDQSSGDFVPIQDQWKNYTVNINNFKSEGFKVRLAWTSGGGNNIYIDNLYIGEAAAVGVTESDRNNAVKLYPNPNKGDLNIVSKAGAIINVQVVNVYGSVVYNADFSTERVNVNMPQAKAGIYFARVTNVNSNINYLKFKVD